MRRSPSSRSVVASASAQTRAMMCPTVRQEIRIRLVIVVFGAGGGQPGDLVVEVPGMGGSVPGPRHRGHHDPVLRAGTRGAAASSSARTGPRSSARHRRRPCPWS